METDSNTLVRFVEGLRCVEHNDKEMELYCTTHNAACCAKCSSLYHRTCDEVLELNANVTNLLKDINPPKIMEEMLKFQGHLSTFLDMNKANISSLKSQGNNPYYRGIAHLHGGEIVLADTNNNTCCLYDSSYNFITMYSLHFSPYDISLIDDNEVAVTMPLQNTVQFLSIKDHLFKDTARVTTRYECDGVATVNKMEIVVAGHCGDNDLVTKCYWSLISTNGKENFHNEFDCPRTTQAYIALNTCKSRVYISVCGGHAVYCFGLIDVRHYFIYKANNLTYPLGVAVDMEDNIYVVGCHLDNINKLAPDGTILQVISSGIPNKPNRISFNANQDQFILTNNSKCKSLHYFTHK
ncbi:hypothetical protein CHS0354_003929 [Potamilus streckersoni]|uniref:B box-type domain-containing protein n=1 Tax=Potamilus streckersoni TaxID=2493646 RepID=A0AAE0VPQ3_9BIVA|nr:hypothetical protein CHS0354_003929 [Potamilus streckersoni]